MSTFISSNLALLRKRRKLSQQALADEVGVSRSALSAWENGTAEPSLEVLVALASQWSISLDRLVRQGLSALREHELAALERGLDADITGQRLRVLATTVNARNEENVELVSEQARAGYTAGYADPEYVAALPTLSLPFLSPNRTYRAFPIKGDSMPPVPDGSYVVAEYLPDWSGLKSGTSCIVVTATEGIVFKRVENHLGHRGTLELISTNPAYDPYEVHASDVLEVWTFVYYFTRDLSGADEQRKDLARRLEDLQRDVQALRNRL